jgi:hypothetical protein
VAERLVPDSTRAVEGPEEFDVVEAQGVDGGREEPEPEVDEMEEQGVTLPSAPAIRFATTASMTDAVPSAMIRA